MALLQHRYFPRSMFDMDQWFREPVHGPNTLDLFDPFDELDNTISRNLQWLNRPEFLNYMPLFPKVPQKYRITLDCVGFSPKSITTDITDNNKLVVHGREESKQGEDFSVREFKKTFSLPENSEKEKMVSFMATGGRLVVEVPLKETDQSPNQDLFPQIVDKNGSKVVKMQFVLPENVDSDNASVSVKDRDLVFRVEDKIERPDKSSKFYFYKRTTLPENTEFNQLKCVRENNVIKIEAPLNVDFTRSYRSVPIEHKSQQTEPEKKLEHVHLKQTNEA
ncbi:Alpha-crystallin B chain [Brachionus plicatilis]|uniref:Alpha-crystallin B chain n=1 Tax=Brachionus plicatilis TaxID=10195 RepID=A0A3M7R602_BRAPC|nr:Alpha-crystallin B chain [Brachionus plicatilis]